MTSGQDKIMITLLLGLAVSLTGLTVFVSLFSYDSSAQADFLRVLHHWDTKGVIYALWVQIESHRMVLPRLILLLDHVLFDGDNTLIRFVVPVLHLAMAGIVTHFIWLQMQDQRVVGVSLIAITFSLALGPYYSIFTGQNHLWVTVVHSLTFCAILLTWLGLRADRSNNKLIFAGAFVSLIAAFSALPGTLAWPGMMWLAIARRSILAGGLVVATIITFVLLFRIDMTSSHSSSEVISLIMHPVHSIEVLSKFIGITFGRLMFFEPLSNFAAAMSMLTGCVGTVIAGYFLVKPLFNSAEAKSLTGLAGGLLLLSLFWLAAAMAKHGQPGVLIDTPLDRFWAQSGWFWICLLMLMVVARPITKVLYQFLPIIVSLFLLGMMPVAIVSALNILRGS